MLEKYHKLQPKPNTSDELKAALQTTWKELPQEHINKAVANFTKRLMPHGCGCQSWSARASAATLSPTSHQQQTGSFQSH